MTQTKKHNSLQAVLDRQGAAPVTAEDTPESPRSPRRAAGQRPSREGKRLVAGHFSPAVAKQLKLLAVEEDKSVQALLEEALDLLFIKKGKGHIGRDV